MATKDILESYKGVRDFYPEDEFVQDYIKETMSAICESFGYEHYGASVLELADLYKDKTSQEILNEQTYTFTDRGGREVVLRPEMTPTVARMVAKKRRELGFPLRLYSIPNLFRYERPQKGRLREHWQLNADLFGQTGLQADMELIHLAHSIIIAFGAKQEDFLIKINSRQILDKIFDKLQIPQESAKSAIRVLDRKYKISVQEFETLMHGALGNMTEEFLNELTRVEKEGELTDLVKSLKMIGIENVQVDTAIVRGFDYYTGIVFEMYDINSQNPRAMFGGGRYDKLMNIFGADALPAVGFGMGDVTIKDFLTLHNLLPQYEPATQIMLISET